MKGYSTVIFDLDGTLLDTLEDLTNAVNRAMRECGYPEHTMEEVRGYVGDGIGLLIRRALPPECDGEIEPYEMALQTFKSYYARHHNDATAPYPGVEALLNALQKAGVHVAVVSNKNDANVKALCSHYFADLVERAAGETPELRRKPEPDTVLDVMKALGAIQANTLYVGDSEVDLQTAKNAGLDCAAVCWGFRTEEQLKKAGASRLFHTPEALKSWILETK